MRRNKKARADVAAPTRATDGGSFDRDQLNPQIQFNTGSSERQAGNQKSKEYCSLSYDRRLIRYEQEKELLRFRALAPEEDAEAVQELAKAWQI